MPVGKWLIMKIYVDGTCHAQKDSPKTENVHLLGDKTEKQELNSNLQRMNEIEWKTVNGELLV